MSSCGCNVTLSNTGTAGCSTAMAIAKKIVFVNKINAAGNPQFVTVASAKLFANVENYLNVGTAPKSRWFPSPELENLEDLREDPVFQTFNSGLQAKVRDGFRTFTAYIPNGDTELLGRLKSYECSEIGAFILDQDDNFIHSNGGDATIPQVNAYPILIDKNTWDVQLVKPTDAEVQMIMIKFQWKQSEKDENLRMIPSTALDWNREDLYGLINVYGTEITCGQTTTEVDIYAINSTSETEPITGLLVGNFGAYNLTTSSSVTVTASAESTTVAGRYTLTYASQTVSDELQFSIAKDRYDSEVGLEQTVFTVV